MIPLRTKSKQDWRTPPALFTWIECRLGVSFKLDAAASAENKLCKAFYTQEVSGLDNPWKDATFCNPPYASISDWIDKAWMSWFGYGVRSVLVLPARLEAKWFYLNHPHCFTIVLTPRVAFIGGGKSPPHGTMLMCFGFGRQGEIVVEHWQGASK